MNPSKTLSDRFRLHRTDRIRVDGKEVLSVVELRASVPTSIEIVIEQCRSDVTEALVIESVRAPLAVWRSSPVNLEAMRSSPVSQVTVDARVGAAIEFVVRPERRSVIRLWNAWKLGESHHAWLGNSGIIVDELDNPSGADRRLRLWCSDGYGNPTFDDLVAILTIGPALLTDDDGEHAVLEFGDSDRVIRSHDDPLKAKWRSGEEQ